MLVMIFFTVCLVNKLCGIVAIICFSQTSNTYSMNLSSHLFYILKHLRKFDLIKDQRCTLVGHIYYFIYALGRQMEVIDIISRTSKSQKMLFIFFKHFQNGLRVQPEVQPLGDEGSFHRCQPRLRKRQTQRGRPSSQNNTCRSLFSQV